jgi:VanZ family protein
MNKRRQRWALAFLWMAVIFFLSSQNGSESSGLSTSLFKPLFEMLSFTGISTDNFSLIIRKSAHFISYLILGILVFRALDTYQIELSQKVYMSMLLCIGYAISDEIHQIFVPGRAGTLMDIFIDSAGSATSLAFMHAKRIKEVNS